MDTTKYSGLTPLRNQGFRACHTQTQKFEKCSSAWPDCLWSCKLPAMLATRQEAQPTDAQMHCYPAHNGGPTLTVFPGH